MFGPIMILINPLVWTIQCKSGTSRQDPRNYHYGGLDIGLLANHEVVAEYQCVISGGR